MKVVSTFWPIRVDVTPTDTIDTGPVEISSLFKCLNIPTVLLSTQDLSSNLCICSTGNSHLIPFSKINRWRIIPTDGWSHQQLNLLGPISLYVSFTHVSLHGNNLHTTSKDPTTHLYLPYMEREALRPWSLNSKSYLQGNSLHSMDLGQLYTTI